MSADVLNDRESNAKRAKLSENSNEALDLRSQQEEEVTIHRKADLNLSAIKFVRILNDSPLNKSVFVEGLYNGEKVVIIFEKTPFSEASVKQLLERGDNSLKQHFHNDIYGDYTTFPNPELNGLKTTIIHPATEKHIEKYSAQQLFLIEESAEDYANITLPYIESTPLSIDWVYNILEHKSETDRIIFEDPDPELGFILLPDLKWNGQQTNDLYLVAICHKRNIKSLRDLNQQHLPLLRNIQKKGTEAISKKYDLKPSELRIYVHYQPSFYHLHIHFTALFDAPGSRVERAHLLSTIINNIELYGDYYQKSRLTFAVRKNDALFAKFEELKKFDT
ncbi:m7GpppX diphosphatase-like protein [Dinothrombium tinctorium]|uniref:m7GpppX diphosphatase n=1 Tax=Dinothrombium tinctorium TaxID=1965070 RepID=A0A3S3QIP5_9ACAR|nr:m7GpppX diphosphatase-like protein [Dinothrombium tinctorium]RWS12750.1 m7GpppX diphosphatase-like protein [Dinothrombium tinctorium]